MTQQRINQINQLLESYQQTDANDEDADKTAVIAELLAEIANREPKRQEC